MTIATAGSAEKKMELAWICEKKWC